MDPKQENKADVRDISQFMKIYHFFSSKGINFYAQHGKKPAYKGSTKKALNDKQVLAKLYQNSENESIGLDLTNNPHNIVCLDIDSSVAGNQILLALENKHKRGFVKDFLIIETQTKGHLHLYCKNSENESGYLNFYVKNSSSKEITLSCGIKAELKVGFLTFFTPGRKVSHIPDSLASKIPSEDKHLSFCSIPFLPYENKNNEKHLKDVLIIDNESTSLVPVGSRHNTLFEFLKFFKVPYTVVDFIRTFFFEAGPPEYTEKEAQHIHSFSVKDPRNYEQHDIGKSKSQNDSQQSIVNVELLSSRSKEIQPTDFKKETINEPKIQEKISRKSLSQEDEETLINEASETVNNRLKEQDKPSETKSPSIERLLRNLVYSCYQEKQRRSSFITWKNLLDNYPKKLQRNFLNLEPFLPKWYQVFECGTPVDTITFILSLYRVYGIMLPCEIWYGKSLRLTLIIVYIHLTKEYLIYVKDTNSWHMWKTTHWITTNLTEIMSKLNRFVVDLGLLGLDSLFHLKTSSFINSIQALVSIETWPDRKGINAKNGFFFINPKTREYVLAPHSPGWFQKTLYGANIDLNFKLNLPMNRWLLDLANEDRYNYINLLAFIRLCLNPAGTSIIANLNGPPRCGKTLIMEFLEQLMPNAISYGSFDSINSFQRKNLLVDKRVVAFPDANLKKLNNENVEFIKKLSGRDSIMVEQKGGDDFSVKTESLVVLISNNTYEEVEAFHEPALRDRILNLSIEGIDPKVTVPIPDLKNSLFTQNNLDLVFALALGIPISLTKKLNRGGETRSLIESDQTNFISEWTQKCLFSLPNNFEFDVNGRVVVATLGKKLFDAYNTYVETYNENNISAYRGLKKRSVIISIKSFYRELDYCLGSLSPKTIYKKKVLEGITYVNLSLKSSQTIDKKEVKLSKLSYPIPEDLKQIYDINPLVPKRLSIADLKGNQEEGKLLDPSKRLESFKVHNKIKHMDLNELICNAQGFKKIYGISHLPSVATGERHIFSNFTESSHSDENILDSDYQSELKIQSDLIPPLKDNKQLPNNLTSQFLFSRNYLLTRFTSKYFNTKSFKLVENLETVVEKKSEYYLDSLEENEKSSTLKKNSEFEQVVNSKTEDNFLYNSLYLGQLPIVDVDNSKDFVTDSKNLTNSESTKTQDVFKESKNLTSSESTETQNVSEESKNLTNAESAQTQNVLKEPKTKKRRGRPKKS